VLGVAVGAPHSHKSPPELHLVNLNSFVCKFAQVPPPDRCGTIVGPPGGPVPETGTGGETGFWVFKMTDSDEEVVWRKWSGDDGSSESTCDDAAEVVDSYASAESFCVCRRGTKKTQSGHDLKTPKE
jgi:hypothetical protein